MVYRSALKQGLRYLRGQKPEKLRAQLREIWPDFGPDSPGGRHPAGNWVADKEEYREKKASATALMLGEKAMPKQDTRRQWRLEVFGRMHKEIKAKAEVTLSKKKIMEWFDIGKTSYVMDMGEISSNQELT